ncbi:hypothetical protein U1Q18_024721 [Sarracenia purpurea var. burkii]
MKHNTDSIICVNVEAYVEASPAMKGMGCHGVGSIQAFEEEPTQDEQVEGGIKDVQHTQLRGMTMVNLEMVSQAEETTNSTLAKNSKDSMKRVILVLRAKVREVGVLHEVSSWVEVGGMDRGGVEGSGTSGSEGGAEVRGMDIYWERGSIRLSGGEGGKRKLNSC